MKEITATILASMMQTVGVLCFLGLASAVNGPIGPREFAIMAGSGVAFMLVVFLVWFAGMALRWVFGGGVDHD